VSERPGRGLWRAVSAHLSLQRRDGVGPARVCSPVGKKRQLGGDVGERILEIRHGDSQEADDVPVPSFGPRMVCTGCGIVGADARPNWKDRQERPSLTGEHWTG
jgi:hypothetical protein